MASNILFLLGLVMLIFFWPGGVLLILVAIILWAIAKGQPKPTPTAICSNCGNPVARTANICPTCQIQLIPSEGPLAPPKPTPPEQSPEEKALVQKDTIRGFIIMGGILLVAVVILIVMSNAH